MKTITLALESVLHLALGSELRGTRVLPNRETGIILDTLFKGECLFKVQFETWDGEPLELPVLWSYPEWYNSSTNYRKQKDNAHKEKIARWIIVANIKIVTRYIMRELLFDEEQASLLATRLVTQKKLGNIRAINPETMPKLVTTEEELQ